MTIAIGVRRQWAIQSIDNPIAALSIFIVESSIFSLIIKKASQNTGNREILLVHLIRL